jgi:hypothetical protein
MIYSKLSRVILPISLAVILSGCAPRQGTPEAIALQMRDMRFMRLVEWVILDNANISDVKVSEDDSREFGKAADACTRYLQGIAGPNSAWDPRLEILAILVKARDGVKKAGDLAMDNTPQTQFAAATQAIGNLIHSNDHMDINPFPDYIFHDYLTMVYLGLLGHHGNRGMVYMSESFQVFASRVLNTSGTPAPSEVLVSPLQDSALYMFKTMNIALEIVTGAANIDEIRQQALTVRKVLLTAFTLGYAAPYIVTDDSDTIEKQLAEFVAMFDLRSRHFQRDNYIPRLHQLWTRFLTAYNLSVSA